jgi:hypothetical protein
MKGPTSPQPIVTTASEACTCSVVISCGTAVEMSMPTSAIAWTATGLMLSPGSLPPDRTSTVPSESDRMKPAAICDLPALWTQTNRTTGFGLMPPSWPTSLSRS